MTCKRIILWTQRKTFLCMKITVWLGKAKPCKLLWKVFRWCFCGLYDSILFGYFRNLSDFQRTASVTFKILTYSELKTLVYSDIFSHIQAYSALLRCIHAYWYIIKKSSGLFRHFSTLLTFAYSQPCHIPSPGIFTTEGIFKTLGDFYKAIQNLAISQNS